MLLNRKKNIILHGAPGVGKSFVAKKIAYAMMGVIDESRIEMIQFHQSYSYEDFIEGFRPNNNSFVLKKGSFYNFCQKAIKDQENSYFFIIDEINRGNISKIMGELMFLIEHDKRGREFGIKTAYSDEKFYIPENVFIIGMMNSADRSLAMMDYALRRIFSFVEIKPAFDNEKFIENFSFNYGDYQNVIKKMIDLNKFIEENLDKGLCIGHSYFCSNKILSESDVNNIFKYEIIELLKEYFFDDEDLLNKALSII